MSRGRAFALASLVIVAVACPAAAGIVYDNGGPTGGFYAMSDFYRGQQVAAPFALSAPAVVRRVQWWGVYPNGNNPSGPDDWTLRFFDVGVDPSTPFYTFAAGDVGRTDTGQQIFDVDDRPLEIYEYSAQIPDVALAAGTDYLLSVVANTAPMNEAWGWVRTTPNGGFSYYRYTDQDGWGGLYGVYAFNLADDQAASVPEPATLTLLALGGLGLLRRRRRS